MKYKHRCPHCSREGTKKYRGVWFCDLHYKQIRKRGANKSDKQDFFITEKLVSTLESGISIYEIKVNYFRN